jgi:hypothetical protein
VSAHETDDGATVITCDGEGCTASVVGTFHRDFPEAATLALRAGWSVPTDPTRPDLCPAHGGEGRSQFVDHARPDVVAHCPVVSS